MLNDIRTPVKGFSYLLKVLFFFLFTSFQSFSQTPLNDECTGAISLAVNLDNNCTNSYSSSIGFATQSYAPCTATGNPANDIWFKFVATSSTHRIAVAPIGSDDYSFQVYGGSCANLVSLAC